ncbi:MAG: hypothetical protein MUF18_08390 [Fimbriiglobus sp.]|jgi:hypothetical protein|nr:hypothetical protein [Fimbriiglobus sp.]
MPDNSSAEQLARRVAELEAELLKTKQERDLYRETVYTVFRQHDPYTTPTAEELHDMMHAPRGEPLADIIAAVERQLGPS